MATKAVGVSGSALSLGSSAYLLLANPVTTIPAAMGIATGWGIYGLSRYIERGEQAGEADKIRLIERKLASLLGDYRAKMERIFMEFSQVCGYDGTISFQQNLDNLNAYVLYTQQSGGAGESLGRIIEFLQRIRRIYENLGAVRQAEFEALLEAEPVVQANMLDYQIGGAGAIAAFGGAPMQANNLQSLFNNPSASFSNPIVPQPSNQMMQPSNPIQPNNPIQPSNHMQPNNPMIPPPNNTPFQSSNPTPPVDTPLDPTAVSGLSAWARAFNIFNVAINSVIIFNNINDLIALYEKRETFKQGGKTRDENFRQERGIQLKHLIRDISYDIANNEY